MMQNNGSITYVMLYGLENEIYDIQILEATSYHKLPLEMSSANEKKNER